MTQRPELRLTKRTISELRKGVPTAAERTVAAIIDDVPSYSDALSGKMGETIRNAVELALAGFISLAARSRGGAAQTPTAPAVDGAYQLGRGEARSGRTVDALLSAYRIGARVSWQEMSSTAVRTGVDAETLARFAELVFAYIDELSAASVAGHNDELATSGRVRQRMLERLADHLLDGSNPDVVETAAENSDWTPPRTLTAVIVPESQVRTVLNSIAGETLQSTETLPTEAGEGMVLLLVPDVDGRRRSSLIKTLEGRDAVAGPARPWLEVRSSYDRALRVRALGLGTDSEEHLRRAGADRRPERAVRPPRAGTGPAGRRACLERGQADRDTAFLAAAPRTPGRRRGRAVRARADRALPHGAAARALR